jgi:hypothetical protein
MNVNRLLRRKAASDYLRETHGLERAPSTLAKLAVIGGGPTFRRAGRVPFYATADLDDWVSSLFSAPMRSTSEVDFADSDMSEFPLQRKTETRKGERPQREADVSVLPERISS